MLDNFIPEQVHISMIRPGDIVIHQGRDRTISKSNISHDPFMGITIFGDSYHLGLLPVTRLKYMPVGV
jgi:hypothetical protein